MPKMKGTIIIERNVKRAAKNTGNLYKVQEITFEDFFDLKSLAQSVGLGSH